MSERIIAGVNTKGQTNRLGSVAMDEDRPHIVAMGANDIPAMGALERAAWTVPLQAAESTMAARAQLGHHFLGAWQKSELIALACFVITRLDPFDAAAFPRTFAEFSTLPRSSPPLSGYVYNLCVHPLHRGEHVVRQIIETGIGILTTSGCRYLVGDGRCPSYAGTDGDERDPVKFNPAFRSIIDNWRLTGIKPPDDQIALDPVLRFYKRALGCDFVYLMPDFLPADAASGGHRVIFVKTLKPFSHDAA